MHNISFVVIYSSKLVPKCAKEAYGIGAAGLYSV